MEPANQLVTWTHDRGVIDHQLASGIDIRGTRAFRDQTADALEQIKKTPTGRQLLTFLINRIRQPPGTGVIIGSVDPAASSRCEARDILLARTPLTLAIRGADAERVAEHIEYVLRVTGNTDHWLEYQLRQMPDYRKDGPPASGPSSVPVTAAHVWSWLTRTAPFPQPFAGDQALILTNSLKIVLAGTGALSPGPGISSRVYWNQSDTIVLTSGQSQRRPVWLGLAHELIHAYHNMFGLQLDNNEGDLSAQQMLTTVLGEYMCVGLGPWKNAWLSENKMRAEAGLQQRSMY